MNTYYQVMLILLGFSMFISGGFYYIAYVAHSG